MIELNPAMPQAPILDRELTTRKILVQAKDVVYVKSILEGYGGIATVFAEQGGELMLAAPHSRVRELDELLIDLKTELVTLVILAANDSESEAGG
jgi:hypothetical protein